MHDPNDSTAGNASSDSSDSNAVNTFNADRARELGGMAKTGAPARRPWDDFDPKEKADPKRPFSLRLNRYDKAIAAYVAGLHGTSIQQALVKLLRDAAKADIARREAPKRKAG